MSTLSFYYSCGIDSRGLLQYHRILFVGDQLISVNMHGRHLTGGKIVKKSTEVPGGDVYATSW